MNFKSKLDYEFQVDLTFDLFIPIYIPYVNIWTTNGKDVKEIKDRESSGVN
jgi:hypothetical protein